MTPTMCVLAVLLGSVALALATFQPDRTGHDGHAVALPGRIAYGDMVIGDAALDDDDWIVAEVRFWATDAPGLGPTRGVIEYSASKDGLTSLTIEARFVAVEGNEAWISGPVIDGARDDLGAGRYMLVRAIDGRGGGADRFWMRWIDDKTAARRAVETRQDPGTERLIVAGSLSIDNEGPILASELDGHRAH